MQHAYTLKDLRQIPAAKIGILQSKWHSEYTDMMVTKCREVLLQAGCLEPDLHVVSGSLEIPLCARRLARTGKGYEALIAFGIIMKGETYHFEMITNECMRGLGQVMFEEDLPIIVEVLPVTSMKQVEDRCGDNEFNKGIEAAIAAIETIAWRRENPVAA